MKDLQADQRQTHRVQDRQSTDIAFIKGVLSVVAGLTVATFILVLGIYLGWHS
jgi:uncharacterized membrane protein YidH (DUF202 family)